MRASRAWQERVHVTVESTDTRRRGSFSNTPPTGGEARRGASDREDVHGDTHSSTHLLDVQKMDGYTRTEDELFPSCLLTSTWENPHHEQKRGFGAPRPWAPVKRYNEVHGEELRTDQLWFRTAKQPGVDECSIPAEVWEFDQLCFSTTSTRIFVSTLIAVQPTLRLLTLPMDSRSDPDRRSPDPLPVPNTENLHDPLTLDERLRTWVFLSR
ncbi:hypothetical protein Z043_106282 [Scleropages formosus]|uniref:Uncharacterized protein n=1 Tax=Scleropages formosus TaxID=113540 RepID=A0A0P7V0Q6_SCLFO|nr:hypothetical protein Z043_106282 [Scleropages formosus]